jgi:hypothetical protein
MRGFNLEMRHFFSHFENRLGLKIKPNMSDFFLDLHPSLAHQGFVNILDRATGMPAVFAKPYASRSRHISSRKIAHIRFNKMDQDCAGF